MKSKIVFENTLEKKISPHEYNWTRLVTYAKEWCDGDGKKRIVRKTK